MQTIVVGGGQGGLAVSYYLSRQTRSHVVIEQSDGPAHAWRNHRWGSFTLNTPNWQTWLPGAESQGDAPDSFMSRQEIVEYFEQYIEHFELPGYRIRATEVEQNSRCCSYLAKTNRGTSVRARNLVIDMGLHQTPKIPSFSSDLPRAVRQLHSDSYRNPQELFPGAVLVVGSAQSGCQIAEELYQR